MEVDGSWPSIGHGKCRFGEDAIEKTTGKVLEKALGQASQPPHPAPPYLCCGPSLGGTRFPSRPQSTRSERLSRVAWPRTAAPCAR